MHFKNIQSYRISNIFQIYLYILFLLIISVNIISCKNNAYKERTTGIKYIEELHSFLKFTAYTNSNEEFNKFVDIIIESSKKYSDMVSIYKDGGEANIINNEAFYREITLSENLEYLIKKTLYYSEITDGAFDITIKPVFDLWNFEENIVSYLENGDSIKPPSSDEIAEKLKYVDYNNIIINNNRISFKDRETQILLGGAAKGFILEKIRERLISEGLTSGIIEVGGDIITFGSKPDNQNWNIGIRNPRTDDDNFPHIEGYRHIIYGIGLINRCVASSGDYQQFYYDDNGNRIHHIINPETGYPADEVISATVIATSILDADILSTAIFVMGADKGTALINSLDGIESLIIYSDGDNNYKTKFSDNFSDFILISP